MPGVLLILIMVGQRPIALAVGEGRVVWTFFCRLSFIFLERARYRLKYCLKGPLKPKQPTNQYKTKNAIKFKPFKDKIQTV